MKIKYFPETNTLYVEFGDAEIAETRNVDQNTQVDVDGQGAVCGTTIEHANRRTDVPNLFFEQVAA